jgi:hypothetical protein
MQTDWDRVERSINQVITQLEQANTEEQFQSIGLLCRETLISLAQTVYNSKVHTTSDGVIPSATDAKRMLEAYLQYELQGSSQEAARKFAKSALELANDLQHRRTANFRDALLCLEATHAIIKVVELLSGRAELTSKGVPYQKIYSLMPELIEEMSIDLKKTPLIRDFFVVSKKWVMNYGDPCFVYYTEDHENLSSKIKILENYGFVIDISPGNAPKYRIMENFSEYLLALHENSQISKPTQTMQ